ncbi:HdeD family acid-resistance protein [Mesorhizobium sp. BAC0120]|uniref:HdeD family acid-resistance protein n=1 Tax=Mesorhizobium sp. BAC0120 TaxID=3090670 RepID=UPI00298CED0E|nr:HdeD family acid-resistance protein [Mesorhizobium sp. BAC0120]MDW6023133.1 HdeD family acid-resistance protein [Mesorhizobium sp. BAC0120]
MAGISVRQPRVDGAATEGVDYERRAVSLHSRWGWFLALGVVMGLGGALAVMLPAVSTFATSVVLGIVLALAGVVKMVQSLQVKEWSGFIWQELTGAVEVVGGILIYFSPLKGALAITLLIALVFFVQGILQIALAAAVRKQDGWHWFAVSGLVALAASAALALKLPHTTAYEPGVVAGISLLVAGGAYIAIALTMRRARP